MKKILALSMLIALLFNCGEPVTKSENTTEKAKQNEKKDIKTNDFAIVIHGGAGTILKKNMTAEREAEYRAKLEEAIKVGHTILKNGGTSLDAVEKTINVLEDSPLFNAGKGAVFTNAETNELDASIMDGKTLNAGASAGTTTVKNPINLARKIMDKSPHVMLAGNGADLYAKEQGLEMVSPDYFYTENRFQSLQRAKKKAIIEQDHNGEKDKKTAGYYDADIKDYKLGTVGCVALDKNGNLAAGTSTGGMTNKRFGRVGDVPIIGAGTYADNKTCAVSGTGWGEYFIRATVARDISVLMEYKGLTLEAAAKEVIHNKLTNMGGTGGIIAVDKNGNMVMDFNTAGMYRAKMDANGELVIEIYSKKE